MTRCTTVRWIGAAVVSTLLVGCGSSTASKDDPATSPTPSPTSSSEATSSPTPSAASAESVAEPCAHLDSAALTDATGVKFDEPLGSGAVDDETLCQVTATDGVIGLSLQTRPTAGSLADELAEIGTLGTEKGRPITINGRKGSMFMGDEGLVYGGLVVRVDGVTLRVWGQNADGAKDASATLKTAIVAAAEQLVPSP